MKRLVYSGAALALVASAAFTPRPAVAMPTCEQEVRIRCSGYGVQGRPRLDIYYDSFEECMAAEQPMRCGTEYDPYASLNGGTLDAITRRGTVRAA